MKRYSYNMQLNGLLPCNRDTNRIWKPASVVLLGWLALTFMVTSKAFAQDEACRTCTEPVGISGDFKHYRLSPSVEVSGAGAAGRAFHEDIQGNTFTVTISRLPAGKYTVAIGAVETEARKSGERVFDVTSAGKAIATGVDIFSAAGGRDKVATIHGTVQHADDSDGGPLAITFTSRTGLAAFNTLTVKKADGSSEVALSAMELADPFSPAATRVQEVSDPPIFHDPSKPLAARIDDVIRRMSLAEKVGQLKNAAPAISRIGLPAYDYWNEALHGVANNGDATVFPEPIGAASSFNPKLLGQEGRVIGIEGRAKFNQYANEHNGDSKWWNGLTFWTPNINIFRDPRWGRGQETYGEDPYLTGAIGVEFVKGIQGDDPNTMLAMACAKHYAVHSGPEADRHRFDAKISDNDLYDTYLPQFERVVREGHVAGVMGAYSSVDGVPCCANSLLLDDLLRKQWGFEGYVVSDCDAVRDIWTAGGHHYVSTPEEAAAAAVKAGCNLCCGGDYNALVRAVQKGLVSEKEVDQALYHTLWTRFKLGLFDPADKIPYSNIGIDQNDTEEHRKLALEVARQSLVLLKNSGILPLNRPKLKRVAVIGPNGNSVSMLHGNYHGSASHPISILNGIKQLAGPGVEVSFALGCPVTTKRGTAAWSGQDNTTTRPLAELRDEALKTASSADVVVYVGGITPAQEGEGFDRDAIELPDVQEKLIQALYATGKPMVMVNCSGSAVALTWEASHLPAILQAWYPGEEGGRAVAEVLFGDKNPSGHLPITFYRATSDLPDFKDYSMANRTYRFFKGRPLFAFGHGLSYTDFQFGRARLESRKVANNGIAKVSFSLKNSGKREGDEIAQVYYRRTEAEVAQPKLALCGFIRVHLRPGEAQKVFVDIPLERLRHWDTVRKQYVVEPGKVELLIGDASDDIRLKLPLTVAASAGRIGAR